MQVTLTIQSILRLFSSSILFVLFWIKLLSRQQRMMYVTIAFEYLRMIAFTIMSNITLWIFNLIVMLHIYRLKSLHDKAKKENNYCIFRISAINNTILSFSALALTMMDRLLSIHRFGNSYSSTSSFHPYVSIPSFSFLLPYLIFAARTSLRMEIHFYMYGRVWWKSNEMWIGADALPKCFVEFVNKALNLTN